MSKGTTSMRQLRKMEPTRSYISAEINDLGQLDICFDADSELAVGLWVELTRLMSQEYGIPASGLLAVIREMEREERQRSKRLTVARRLGRDACRGGKDGR